MRIDDVIYFSPELKAVEVDFDNQNQILNAFQSRIHGYYLFPAHVLNEKKQAFAAGVILLTAIDAITYYSIGGGNRIKEFVKQLDELQRNSKTKKEYIARGFNDYFRNGLIHEGRIKSCGQFSYDYDPLIAVVDNFFVINPEVLAKEVDLYFHKFFEQLNSNAICYSNFINKLKIQFEQDINSLKLLNQ